MSNLDNSTVLKRTPLYALHEELGAKLVAFSGYAMPLQYSNGIIAEHNHTRNQAGLFDISHMGQIRLAGPAAASELEKLIPTRVCDLPVFTQRYSVFTNENGGIIDDFMVANADGYYFLVVNASRKQVDLSYLRTRLGGNCEVNELENQALLALQGPKSSPVLMRHVPGVETMPFMSLRKTEIATVPCLVTRCGYTGEDGYEISLPADRVEQVARLILAESEVAAVGLGARDSLRLEAGLCLYGHDIDETTTPVEAGLHWIIASAYRQGKSIQANFPGAAKILAELNDGPGRRRVGLMPEGRAPIREGADILDIHGASLGRVTSGGFGPTVNRPVAMAYVESGSSSTGTPLTVVLREKVHPLTVVRLPFVEHRYAGNQTGGAV